jgi:hypothetical protein
VDLWSFQVPVLSREKRMNKWNEIVEEGHVFYENDEVGCIQKLTDGIYLGMVPKVIKLGPFKDLEEAKKILLLAKADIDKLVEEYNLTLTGK